MCCWIALIVNLKVLKSLYYFQGSAKFVKDWCAKVTGP